MDLRQRKILTAYGLLLVVAAGIGLASSGLINWARSGAPLPLIVVLLAVLVAGVCVAALPWWRRLDHMQRDEHLTGYYWGASFGGGVAWLTTGAIGGVTSELFRGAAIVMVAQAGCYLLFRLWWRMAHRATVA